MLEKLSKLKPGSTFLTLRDYRNNFGEIADYSIVFNFSYENALRRSIIIAEEYDSSSYLSRLAKKEVIESYRNSLDKFQSSLEVVEDPTYDYCYDNGKMIKGVKRHRKTGVVYIFGLINAKRVIVPGVYKEVDKRALTIEKDKIRKLCPASKYRQFKLLPSHLDSVVVQGMELLPGSL